jgi:BioD-like phosphotransacetylase family protein
MDAAYELSNALRHMSSGPAVILKNDREEILQPLAETACNLI